jgi:hypothetical protein
MMRIEVERDDELQVQPKTHVSTCLVCTTWYHSLLICCLQMKHVIWRAQGGITVECLCKYSTEVHQLEMLPKFGRMIYLLNYGIVDRDPGMWWNEWR